MWWIDTDMYLCCLLDSLLTISYFLGLVMDNASSCDVMAHKVGELLIQRYTEVTYTDDQRIRCVGHVTNLVSQDILAAFGEGVFSDVEDYYIESCNGPVHLDNSTEPSMTEFDGLNDAEDSDVETEEAMLAKEIASRRGLQPDDTDCSEDTSLLGPIQRVSKATIYLWCVSQML